MAMDFEVYARGTFSPKTAGAAFSAAGVTVDADGDAGWLLTHAEGSVWVDAPEWVEPEELPESLGSERSMTRFSVRAESGMGPEAANAVVYAFVAALNRGVLVGPEGEVVWPVQAQPGPSKVTRSVDPDDRLIAITWCGRVQPGINPAGVLWDVAARELPQALPRKLKQPRGPAVSASREKLEEQWLTTDESWVEFLASAPVRQGSLVSRQGALRNSQGMWRLGLFLPGRPFQAGTELEQLRAFFTTFAEETNADYANAEVRSGVTWDRGVAATQADSTSEHLQVVFDPMGRGGLWGLPERPVWWSWFGVDYQRLAARWLAKPRRGWQLTSTGDGVFLSLGDSPLTAPELRSKGHSSAGWIPRDLVPRRRILGGGRLPARRRLGRWGGEDDQS